MSTRATSPIGARRRLRLRARGFVLPAVLLFLTATFAMWAIVFRGGGTALRVEEARTHRNDRTAWSAPAMASALRLLETGNPPTDPFTCKLSLTREGETRCFRATYEKLAMFRWTVTVVPTDADDITPDAPATFLTVPDAPADLVAYTRSESIVYLYWSDVYYDNGYRIERSANGTSGWTQIGTTGRNVTTFASTGLSSSTQYYYRVRGYNDIGDGAYSSIVNATTQTPGSPHAPSFLTATVLGSSSVQLSWTDNADNETSFRLQKSINGTSWSTQEITAANVTTSTALGLTPGQPVYFRVRSSAPGSDSAWSNVVLVTPQ